MYKSANYYLNFILFFILKHKGSKSSPLTNKNQIMFRVCVLKMPLLAKDAIFAGMMLVYLTTYICFGQTLRFWLVQKCMDGLCSDQVLQCHAAESDSAVHNGRTGFNEEYSDKNTHIGTHKKASRGRMFCSSALHLFIAKYNQRNPGLLLPLLCVSWVGQRMEGGKKDPGSRKEDWFDCKDKKKRVKSLWEKVERRVNLEWCGHHPR